MLINIGFFLFAGCDEGTKASYLDGYNCQRYLCSVLAGRLYDLPPGLLHPQAHRWRGGICSYFRNDTVEFRCQPDCVRSSEPTLPAEDQANGLLSLPPRESLQGIAKDQQCQPHDQGGKRRNLQGSPQQGYWPGD